jgi:hypothetical protein
MQCRRDTKKTSMKNLLLLWLVLFGFACKKDIKELPGPTETGVNTFGVKVDGKLWGPKGFGIVPTAALLEARYIKEGGQMRITARNFASSPTETEMEIYLKNVTAPGTYLLNTDTRKYPEHTGNYGYFIERRLMPRNEWITNTSAIGNVTVSKFDTASKIISGIFEFTASNIDSTTQRLNVTEGRFDIRYE